MLEKYSLVWESLFCPIYFGQITYFLKNCWKIWEFNKSYARKYSWDFFPKMLEKISGNFGNFSLLGKVINVDFFSFLPEIIGHSEKSRSLNFIGILGILILLNNNQHLINVERSFHFCPNFWGILKISSCFRNFGQFENFFCPIISSRLWRWNFFFGHCPPSQVLSHMKVSLLGRPTLGQISWHPLRQMFHTPRTNVMHSQNKCPSPLR